MNKIKAFCFFCKTKQTLELKVLSSGKEYYICPKCNASNSPTRIEKEKNGKV